MAKQSEAASATVRRILLIDDNRSRTARKSVLEGEGYVVSAFTSPKEALDQFASEPFDLVVTVDTDQRKPGIRGTEMIQALREQRPDIRLVLVSGMVDVLGLNEQNTGADAVIAKTNTEVANMVRTVNRLLRLKKPAGSSKPRASAARRKAG